MRDAALSSAMWLSTYWIHSTLLLGGAWLVAQLRGRHSGEFAEGLWRVALFGGVITASVQLVLSSMRPSLLVFQSSASTATYGLATSVSHETLPHIAPAIIVLWLAIALLRLAALCRSHWMVRRLLSDREPLADATSLALSHALCAGKRIRLSMSAHIATPMVVGASELCLPKRALEDLSRAELDAVLAHELAHIVRRDTLWLLLAALIERVFFFQPLNVLASARIRALAECSCDDWALRRTRNPMALASALARVTEWLVGTPHVELIVGMSSRESTALMRVRRILDPSVPRLPDSHSRHPAISGAILCAVILGAPGISARTSSAPTQRYTIQAHDDAGPFSITLEQGRVVGVSVNGQFVDEALIDQHGASIHVEDPYGDAPLDLTLTPSGGMRWSSRPVR